MTYPTLSDLRKTLNQSATRDDLPDNGIQSRRRVCDRAQRHARDFDLSTRVSGKEFLTRIEQTKVPLCKSRLSRERNGTRRARSLRRSARNLRTCRAATDHKLNCHVVKNGVQVGVNKRDAVYIDARAGGPCVNTRAGSVTQFQDNGCEISAQSGELHNQRPVRRNDGVARLIDVLTRCANTGRFYRDALGQPVEISVNLTRQRWQHRGRG